MTARLRLFLCGEGRNELGSRSGHPSFQSADEPGVIEALLRRVREAGWEVGGAENWKSIVKLRGHGRSPDETDAVAKLMVIAATDHSANVVAYIRDGDDEVDSRRAAHARGQQIGASVVPEVRVVGEVAAPTLEAWLLALLSVGRTEEMTATKAAILLVERLGDPRTAAMVELVERAVFEVVPEDAAGLRRWLASARAALESGAGSALPEP